MSFLLAAVDLAEKLLTFEAGQRITAADALSHAYVWHYHKPMDEPVTRDPLRLEHEVGRVSDRERKLMCTAGFIPGLCY